MTSATSSTGTPLDPSHLGTITVIAWAGENVNDGQDMPFLLAYSLGDGAAGPEAGEVAVRALLERSALPVGGGLVDGSASSVPVSVLVTGNSATLTVQHLNANCVVPPEWTDAAHARGQVYFMFTTKPWPQAAPGVPVEEEALKGFIGDEEVIMASAHCLVPVSTLR